MGVEGGGRGVGDPRREAEFLRRLTHDDELRRRVEADPEGALAEFGLRAPSGGIRRARLPSKASLLQILAAVLVAGGDILGGHGGGGGGGGGTRYWTFT